MKIKKLLPIIILSFLLFPLIAQAQECYQYVDHPCYAFYCTTQYVVDGVYYDCSDANPRYTLSRICCLIDTLRAILYIFGLGLGVLAIIVGGIAYITSAGDQSRTDKAKKIITYGLIGAAIILLSWFIINLLQEVIARALIN